MDTDININVDIDIDAIEIEQSSGLDEDLVETLDKVDPVGFMEDIAFYFDPEEPAASGDRSPCKPYDRVPDGVLDSSQKRTHRILGVQA